MSTHNEILHRTLSKGEATAAALKKALKMKDDEFDAYMATNKGRLWVEEDNSGKTAKYTLTDLGQRDLNARYAED